MLNGEIEKQMNAVVSGTMKPMKLLERVTDWTLIRKVRDSSEQGMKLMNVYVVSQIGGHGKGCRR